MVDNAHGPDIELFGFSLWIEGYEFPDWVESTDPIEFWDANWVNVRIQCVGELGTIRFSGPCIHLSELEQWRDDCLKLHAGQASSAELPTMEPNLNATIATTEISTRFELEIKLRAGRNPEVHEYRYVIHTSVFLQLIEALNRILMRLPIRGTRPNKAPRNLSDSGK